MIKLYNGGIIYGGSAGAIIFGKDLEACKIDDENNVNLEDVEGFDVLNDYSLLCHYTNRNQEITEKSTNYLLELSNKKSILAIPEEDTIIVNENEMEIIGTRPFYIFKNGIKKEYNPNKQSIKIKRKLGKLFESKEQENLKYVKTIYTIKEYEDGRKFPMNKVIIADKEINVYATKNKDMGGLNISTEEFILSWLIKGDTLCDVTIPKTENVYKTVSPNGEYRANKIILSNPRIIDDKMAMELYLKSKLPEISYFKAMTGCAIRGYLETSKQILRDKVTNENISLVLNEFNDFYASNNFNTTDKDGSNVYYEIMEYLNEIKSDLFINISIDKEPYIKEITNDKIINITGESGSGKSYYTQQYLNNDNYIVVDTDEIFDKPTNNQACIDIREMLNKKYENNKPDIHENFDIIYKDIIDYFNGIDKILVIDSAQYRNLKNMSLLKGKIIIMRTCIDKCYSRCIDRWKRRRNEKFNGYTEDDLEKYKNKKIRMYKWYKSLNKFIEKIHN